MEWAPIMGTIPPLSDTEWHRLFALYQKIPQYELVNRGFGIEGFKSIFWLEWAHRLWGRLMGLAFAVPLLIFWARGMISRPLGLRLVLLLVLGGLQGAVGWFMVASGFAADSTAVSAYRLVMHLGLALTLYACLFWTALGLLAPNLERSPIWLRPASAGLVALVALTILAGGFVAGLKAGLIYNEFPLMDGQLVPVGYASLAPWVRNLFENAAAVQFNHRLLATLTATAALAIAAVGLRGRTGRFAGGALIAVGATALAQYALGVTTLLWAVPVGLGTAHQAMAVLLLSAALLLRHTQRSPA
jgi:cytochrome c oxidase assembly protein subunit 15